MKNQNNICFIDWQNLQLWIQSEWWNLDFKRFWIYLKEKFWAKKIFYFLWIKHENEEKMYKNLEDKWFTLVFRDHWNSQVWKKKWNVDTDIVHEMMKKSCEKEKNFNKIILISWDWDYFRTVKYLLEKDLFLKIILPNKKYSSLYKKINWNFRIILSSNEIREKLEYKKKGK